MQIPSTRSVQRSAMLTLGSVSVTLRPRPPIKAFCRFRLPTLPYVGVTLVEEDKRLVRQSQLHSYSLCDSCMIQ